MKNKRAVSEDKQEPWYFLGEPPSFWKRAILGLLFGALVTTGLMIIGELLLK